MKMEKVMKKVTKSALLLALAVLSVQLFVTNAPAQNAAPPSNDPKPAADTNNQAAPAPPPQDLPSDYVIGADDQLHIMVWNEQNFNETVPVRPDGKISMPLLNDVQAAGLTPLQLKDSLTEKLKKYIADPRVTVVVTGMYSRRIFVTGEVVHSGPMMLLPRMTMLQALAGAGFTQFANLKGIYLLRTENGKQTKLTFNYKEVVKGRRPEQNILLKPGDTVVVP
jgi:polysaccharide biosynthesis/export protein